MEGEGLVDVRRQVSSDVTEEVEGVGGGSRP